MNIQEETLTELSLSDTKSHETDEDAVKQRRHGGKQKTLITRTTRVSLRH